MFQEIYDIITNLIYLLILNYIYSARQLRLNMKHKNHLCRGRTKTTLSACTHKQKPTEMSIRLWEHPHGITSLSSIQSMLTTWACHHAMEGGMLGPQGIVAGQLNDVSSFLMSPSWLFLLHVYSSCCERWLNTGKRYDVMWVFAQDFHKIW